MCEESWRILLNPSPLSSNNSYLCRPLSAVLSVCASLHITSSLQILLFQSLSFSCLSLSLSLHPSVSAVFNQKLFHPVGSVGKYNVTNSVTDRHTGILRQNRDTCTRITHLVKCILSDTMDAPDRPLFTFVY